MKKIVFVFAFLLTISFQINAQWFWQNPLPQGNDLLDIQSFNNITGFACGAHGSFIKTTNGGIQWTLMRFPESFDLLGMNFLDSTIGWVRGKKENYVKLYKTTDSGVSWAEQFSSQAQYISSYFINESLGWLSAEGNLFQSTDGGNSWILRQTFDPINYITFIDSMHGWLATNNYKIYYTPDGGLTWQFSSISYPTIWKLEFINESTGWLVGSNDYVPNTTSTSIWKTTDGGLTWLQQFSDGGWGYQYFFTDLDFINDSIGWVINRWGIVFKTSNGGLSWEEISTVYNLLAFAPLSETLLWGCGLFGVNYISTDGGSTWQKNYQGELLYETNELFVLNENNLFIGGNGGLLKTQNGGDTWEKIEITLPDQSYSQARAIWFIDQLHGWIGLEHEGGHGSLHKTTDSGYTWMIQVDSIHRVSDIYFNTYSFGWFVSGNKIFKTSDGGINWSIQAELQEIEPIALQFTSDNLGWIGGYIGLLKTEDAGNSWNEVFPLGMDLNIKDIHFINSLEGWVITDGGFNGPGIYKTTDGGISWINQSITNTVNIRYNDMFFFDNNKGWIVGNDELSKGLILHTSDGGINWNAIHSPSSLYLTKVSFINENDGWILGENGTVLHTTNGGVTFIEEEENNFTQPEKFLLHQNYPNPFNPSTSIQYALSSTQFVTLKVYDVLGREVATLVNEEKPAGTYNAQFTMNNVQLSSGIYFYKLQVGEFVETKKMILLK